jgi:sulfite oxidase
MSTPPIASRRRFLQTTAALAAAGTLNLNRVLHAADSDLIVRTQQPYNAEPPLLALVADALTPTKHFYVRNHGEQPQVDAATYKLRIEGLVENPTELTLAEIKDRFRQHTIEATLTCAGNRRDEMSAIKPVGGVQWNAGAIGHARWTGAMLTDLLLKAGLKPGSEHVWFEGLDPVKEKDGSVAPFGGSIPMNKLMLSSLLAARGGFKSGGEMVVGAPLLAHSMNNQPLTPEHGFPLRVVVPGYIGARSVKWLSKITVSDRPSPNHYLQEAYKVIQSEDKDEVAKTEPIYGFPINAAICSPAAGAMVKAGKTLISGYALPSGDKACTIAKVEVSSDGGKNWKDARLVGKGTPFNMQRWSIELDLSPGKHDLVVCATDTAGNMTPEKGEWNLKGYLYNGWHHVAVEAA